MRQRGFTLIEILLSVALMALVVTLAYGSIRVAIQASRSGEALIERTEETRTAQGFLRRQFSQMLPVAYEFLDTGEAMVFEGDRNVVRFVAPMPGYLSRGGAHVQELALVRSRGGGYQLEFRHAQLNGYDPDEGFGRDREPVVLIDGIRDGAFGFRLQQEDGQLSDWLEQWDDPQQLPLLVRLDLEFDRDDRRDWPEFEVASLAASASLGGGMGSVQMRGPARPQTPRPREAQ